MPSQLLNKPFALTIGPQRCGTSHIEAYLRARGDVCLPADVKEIFYFDRHFQRGPEFYAAHFRPQPHHRLAMEITTTAFDHPDAPSRVKDLFGTDITLICPLRHPVMRSYLVYRDYLRYGIVHGSLEEAVAEAPQILFASRYKDHLERWFAVFGPDKIRVLLAEDMENTPEKFIATLCKALGLSYMPPPAKFPGRPEAAEEKFSLAGRLLAKLPGGARAVAIRAARRKADIAWLQSHLRGEAEKLEAFLHNSLPAWKS